MFAALQILTNILSNNDDIIWRLWLVPEESIKGMQT